MDPTQLTAAQWDESRVALAMLWLCVLAAIFSATNFWLAHAIIPSRVGTKSISPRIAALRPLFYGAGVAGLVAIVIFMVIFATSITWIADFFPNYYQ